jgi:REP element-mobilizing transposase RayT
MTSRRRQRLPLDAYDLEGSAWHVTVSVDRRNGAPFQSIKFGQDILDCFVPACEQDGAIAHLVCVMPDHLHALVEIRSEGLVKVIGRAKSATTRVWWKRGGTGALWQQSFHDHGIREPLDFEAAATYILNNPVEAGLGEEWESYPLVGGTLIAR